MKLNWNYDLFSPVQLKTTVSLDFCNVASYAILKNIIQGSLLQQAANLHLMKLPSSRICLFHLLNLNTVQTINLAWVIGYCILRNWKRVLFELPADLLMVVLAYDRLDRSWNRSSNSLGINNVTVGWDLRQK